MCNKDTRYRQNRGYNNRNKEHSARQKWTVRRKWAELWFMMKVWDFFQKSILSNNVGKVYPI